jgi:hypothetical protein
MKSIFSALISAALLIAGNSCSSQTTKTNTDDSITGIWKGTSLCEQKNGPCHDENVVYHISKGIAANIYTMQANKIVNGKEEEMGTLDFTYDKSKQTLTCKIKDRQEREGLWEFKIKGKQMSGTLVINGNTLFRKIEVTKQ